jgi:very-short-patch-repair endonuclease
MKLYYKRNLNPFAKRLRKAGNLAEVLLWNELKKDKLGCRFLRQRPIGKYIVDFYCSSLNLVVEIDGAASHDCKMDQDKIRQREIEMLGVRFIRFTDADARYNLEGVLQTLKTEILRREYAPPPLQKEE